MEHSCEVPFEVEVAAIAACVEALDPLSPWDRARALNYLIARLYPVQPAVEAVRGRFTEWGVK